MDIKRQLIHGFIGVALGKYLQAGSNILITIFLARILLPEDFGLVAAINVFITFFQLITDSGFSIGIVQHKDLNQNDYRSLFTITSVTGLFLTLVFALLSPVFAWWYGNQQYQTLGLAMSSIVFFSAAIIVPSALIRKNLKFYHLGLANLSATIIGGIAAIIFAKTGFSYFTLPLKTLIENILLLVILLVITKLKPGLPSAESIRKIFGYSSYQFMSNLLSYLVRNFDNFIIGKLFGPIQLGLYERSYRLMKYPLDIFTFYTSPVLHPVLSNFQSEPDRIRSSYCKILFFISAVSLPLSVFIYFNASEIIHVLYGPKWVEAVPIFGILAISSGFQVITSTSSSILQSVGKTKLLFKLTISLSISIIAGILAGVPYGIKGVAIGFTAGYFLQVIPWMYFVFKSINGSLMDFFKSIRYGLLISVIMIFLSLIFSYYCTISHPLLRLIGSGVIFSLIFLTASFIFKPFHRNGIIRKKIM